MRILVDAYGSSDYGDFLRPGVYAMEADGSCLTFLTSGTSADWQPLPGASPSEPARCVDLVVRAAVVPPVGLRGISYSVVVRNDGVVPATGVRLVQRFDAKVRILIADRLRRYCSTSGATLTCEIAVLPPGGQELKFPIVARPRAGGVIQTTLTVSSSETDADSATNEASLRTRVFPCWIAGTDFRDTLVGTAAGERICARAGNDLVRGLGGNDVLDGGWHDDTLVGGEGRDRLIGGRGDDTILARDGELDTLECGWGDDRALVDRIDRVLRGCEVVRRR
jgi:hypothetical protein